IEIYLKDYPAAADAARKSVQAQRTGQASWYLVMALHAASRCPEAVPEIRPAIEDEPKLLAEKSFMLSVADCYFETGDLGNGEAALKALLRENPAVAND